MDSRRPTRAHAAALPHARSRRGRARHVAHGSEHGDRAVQRRWRVRPRGGGEGNALLRRADDVRAARREPTRRRARIAAALRIRVGRARCRCVARARRARRPARHRALRHDRDVHEHVEPSRRRPAPGLGRVRAARCRGPPRRQRRDLRPRTQRLALVLGAPRRHGRRVPRRMVPDRRHRRVRRRRLPQHRRAVEGPDHHGRLQRVSRERSRSCSPSTPPSQKPRSLASPQTSGGRPSSPMS